jgi:hypothetical protein
LCYCWRCNNVQKVMEKYHDETCEKFFRDFSVFHCICVC